MDKYQENTYYSEPTVSDGKTNVTVVYQALGGSVHVDNYRVPQEYADTNQHHFKQVIDPYTAMNTLSALRMNGGVPVDGPDNTPSQTTMIWHSTAPDAQMQTPDFMMGIYQNGNKRVTFAGDTPLKMNSTDITFPHSEKVVANVMQTYSTHLSNSKKPGHTAKPVW